MARATEAEEYHAGEPKRIVYAADSYTVYSDKVIDQVYGGESAPALVPDAETIRSPVRIEPQGKTVVLNHSDAWRPVTQIKKYPRLSTRHATIDAVYNLALDTLYRCSSGEFMRKKGEEGMWQAGFRRGEGYGVWTRDVSYVGLLMGSFLDPEVAQRSIEYVTSKGIDNGEDGLAVPVLAVWNHYLVTGDKSIIEDTFENLREKVNRIQYNEDRGLAFAHSGSFIDSRHQPEAGGFPLSTNMLYALAYDSMARMAPIVGDNSEDISRWAERAQTMRETINREYWRPDRGYYTFGPRGSESYEKGHWENLGQSLVIWPQWGFADPSRRASILDHKNVAYNQYGFTDLNYLADPTHKSLHGKQRWVFTEVGEAAAMAKEGRHEELLELLASVVRAAAMHKSFYECIDWESGKAWRYPGQLWHAMGYLSMIYYGVLGVEYDEQGITFSNACVPRPLEGLSVQGFQYRNATFAIHTSGWGVFKQLQLDGNPVACIPPGLTGEHTILIKLSERQ